MPLVLLLLIPTLVAYWPSAPSEFIFDDKQYISENPHVLTGLSLENLTWAVKEVYASNWHPLTWVSHMLDVELWGRAANGHRATSLLVHLGNVVLLFLVLRSLTGSAIRSWVVAALFALHPMHVESVVWVAERKNLLSTFFGLLAVGAYVRHARRPDAAKYLLLLVSYACSLMSKSMLVTLPFVLLLLDYWPLSRLGPAGRPGRRPASEITARVLEKTPLFLLAAASSVITYTAQMKAMETLEQLPFSARFANAPISYLRYLHQLFLPGDLAVFYPYPSGPPPQLASLGAALSLVSSVVVVLVLAKRRPYLAVGWLWFLGTLVPVLGLVQVGGQSIADRYAYVPSMGLFLASVWLLPDPGVTRRPGKSALAFSASVILLLLTVMTKVQTGYWRDAVTLFGHTIEVTSDNWVAHYQLGLALTAQGRLDEAAVHYREFVRISPTNADAEHNIGTLLLHQGRLQEAVEHFNKALRLRPDYVEARANLGVALLGLGRLEEAHGHFTTVLGMDPRSVSAHGNLGAVLALMGRKEEAISHIREALRLDPSDAKALRMLSKLQAGERSPSLSQPQ